MKAVGTLARLTLIRQAAGTNDVSWVYKMAHRQPHPPDVSDYTSEKRKALKRKLGNSVLKRNYPTSKKVSQILTSKALRNFLAALQELEEINKICFVEREFGRLPGVQWPEP